MATSKPVPAEPDQDPEREPASEPQQALANFSFMVLHDKILVRRHPEVEKVGSLFLAESGREAPSEGTIVGIGQGRITEYGFLMLPRARVGDVVVFGKHSGAAIEVSGEPFLVLREDEILGLWRKIEEPQPLPLDQPLPPLPEGP